MLGFLSHLILDEIYSVDINGLRVKLKASAGSALKFFSSSIVASMVCYGMLGALQRSVLTGLLMLAPPPHPSAVRGSVSAAVTWLLPHLRTLDGFAAPPEEVVAALELLCGAFHARG